MSTLSNVPLSVYSDHACPRLSMCEGAPFESPKKINAYARTIPAEQLERTGCIRTFNDRTEIVIRSISKSMPDLHPSPLMRYADPLTPMIDLSCRALRTRPTFTKPDNLTGHAIDGVVSRVKKLSTTIPAVSVTNHH